MGAGTGLPPGFESGPRPIEPGMTELPGAASSTSSVLKPNRAGLVLLLGIFSLFCCPPLGILAWILGSSDLKGIRDGTVSAHSVGTLRAGWVLGMIGTAFFAIYMLAILLFPHSLLSPFQVLKAGPLLENQLMYAGEWVGDRGTVIRIYPDGTGDYKYKRDTLTSELKGGRVQIQGGRLSIGFFGLYGSWHIDTPPAQADETWTMILDGEVFTKKRSIDRPSPYGEPKELI